MVLFLLSGQNMSERFWIVDVSIAPFLLTKYI